MSTEKKYPEGLLGKKLGMTQIFTEDGTCVPVTVVQLGPCYILDVRTKENNGYSGVSLGFGPKKSQRCNKSEVGSFAKAGKGCFYHVEEVRCDANALGWTNLGQELKAQDVFKDGEQVDVSGVSIGRGFSGVVRRFKVKGQPATRGTHEYRRHIGAIGCRKFPGRVWKNLKMPGRHGNANTTVLNLKIVGMRPEDNVVFIKGGIPGSKGSLVVIRKAKRQYDEASAKRAA